MTTVSPVGGVATPSPSLLLCRYCQRYLEPSCFYVDKCSRTGRRFVCKACTPDYKRACAERNSSTRPRRAPGAKFAPNEYRVEGDTGYIIIRRSSGVVAEALVDAADLPRSVAFGRWSIGCSAGNGYAYCKPPGSPLGTRIALHRFISGAKQGECVDHIDRNSLNNRSSNLRICSQADNTRNRKAPHTNTSGYKGVSRHSGTNRWQARIGIGGNKHKSLGSFATPEEAARAYNAAALERYGEFALLNDVPPL